MKTRIELRLFITGGNETAARAYSNLVRVCEDPWVRRRYDIEIEVLDVMDSPSAADEENVLVTPTLLKKQPPPERRLVGDLSDEKDIFLTLDIDPPWRSEQDSNGSSA